MKRKKITVDYKKLCRSISILSLLIISIMAFSGNFNGSAMVGEQKFELVLIHPGDTLWDIAGEYVTDGDVRDKINEIKKFNNLKSSALVAYETIKIPVD